ncbi:anti-sigma-D factor RsdA [Gordonia sp. CPCC 205515]|uniref:anti-sigma-D factor RsdA n=1 Tax=Gordonia sp. CPCC 205515 TaxID=3140791 RepID=UPI003AF3CE99
MNDERDPAATNWDTTQPIDMTQVHADDQFLDALAADRPVPTLDDTEYQLAELLSGWRHDVVGTPAPELPSIDEIEAAIAATERAQRGKSVVRHLRIISGAAAVVIVAGAGLTVLAQGSSPGDPLWGVKKVVFAEAATQTQASVDVQSNLEKAEAAVAAGNTTEAAELIARAQKDLSPVRDADTKNRMKDWITRLQADAGTTPPKTSASGSTTPDENTTTTSDKTTADQRTNPAIPGPTTPPRDLRRSRGEDRSTTVTVPSGPGRGGDDRRNDRRSDRPAPPPPVDRQSPEPPPQTQQPQPPVTTTPQPATTMVPTQDAPSVVQPTPTYQAPPTTYEYPYLPTTTTPIPWPRFQP